LCGDRGWWALNPDPAAEIRDGFVAAVCGLADLCYIACKLAPTEEDIKEFVTCANPIWRALDHYGLTFASDKNYAHQTDEMRSELRRFRSIGKYTNQLLEQLNKFFKSGRGRFSRPGGIEWLRDICARRHLALLSLENLPFDERMRQIESSMKRSKLYSPKDLHTTSRKDE